MNTENREIMPGETMFDYLKRKKRFILQRTLNRGKASNRSPLQENSMNSSNVEYEKSKREQQRDQNRRESSRDVTKREEARDSNKSTLKEKNEMVTVRRNSIIEQQRKPISRSFIQMISPIRSKSPVRESEKSSTKDGIPYKKDNKENFTKRVLTEKINLMRDAIESQLRAGRNLKQKAHLLFLDLKPFFRHVESCEESGIQRKTDQIKGKIRALESVFKEFNVETHQGTIDQFYIHFSQYLNELEGQAKAQISENKDNLTTEISTIKNREIQDLKDENTKLLKEIAMLSKKYTKLEKSYNDLEQQSEVKQQQNSLKYQERFAKLEDEVISLKERNKELANQISVLKESNIKLEEERKHLLGQKQRFEEECLNTITKVKSQQEEFLLNEIMVLKKEFNIDISRMAELYKIKEEDFMKKISQHEIEVNKLRKIIDDLMEGNKKLDDSFIAVQAQSMRIKKQNQCLATDMHRINEELYQHWLALKDIKTLSQRLDIFQKFRKIYDELLFNEQLFL